MLYLSTTLKEKKMYTSDAINHVRRGVVSGERVLAHEQAEDEDVEVAADPGAVVGVEMGEDELGAGPLGGDGGHGDHEHEDAQHVPGRGELPEEGEHGDGEAVDDGVAEQDRGVEGDHHVLGRQVPAAVLAAGAQQDDHLDQLRQGVVHAGGHRPLHRHTGFRVSDRS